MPRLTFVMQNSASAYSFPGAKKTTVASSGIPFSSLQLVLSLAIIFSISLAKWFLEMYIEESMTRCLCSADLDMRCLTAS